MAEIVGNPFGTGIHTSIKVRWYLHQQIRKCTYGHGRFVESFKENTIDPHVEKIYTGTVIITFKKLLKNGKLSDVVRERLKNYEGLNWH